MEARVRRHRSNQIHDQENVCTFKINVPSKRGLTERGALGELNTNVQAQREVIGKVAVPTAEFEKKVNRKVVRSNASNYSHVQSKVDTGLSTKHTHIPTLKPPLRREESTAGLAARAVAQTRGVLKETQIKAKGDHKQSQNKKNQEHKQSKRLPTLKEQSKENKSPISKEQIVSLGNLKITESANYCFEKIIDLPEDSNANISISTKLPVDIEDIDAGDSNSPLLMSDYIKDIYKYLTELEIKYPIERDHLKKQVVITGNMRATLIDWLAEVHRQFSLVLETFHLTIGIIDRYLQVVPNIQRTRLQLVGVTALFIASKYEEVYAPDISDFVYVTDNAYTKADVLQCERNILLKLGFCLARPIPLSFLRRFVKAAHGTSKNHHLAKYFVDLSLVEYTMAHYRPSELAAAAICLSLYLLSNKKLEDVWTPTLLHYSRYSIKHIEPIIRKIARIVIGVESSKYKAVYNNYLDISLAKVASLPQLKGEAINELAKMPSLF